MRARALFVFLLGLAIPAGSPLGPGPAAQPAEVSVSPPAQVAAGADFAVAWTGPDATGDYLAIAAPGAPWTEFAAYARTREGSPLTLTAPAAPGRYEIRYIAAARGEVLAAAPVTVTGADDQEAGRRESADTEDRAPSQARTTGPGGLEDLFGIYGDASEPGRDFFVAQGKAPPGSDMQIPPGVLMLGATWGDVAPWYLEPVSDVRFRQRWANPGAEPIVVEFERGPGGRAVALTFVSGVPGRGRLERLGDLPPSWQ